MEAVIAGWAAGYAMALASAAALTYVVMTSSREGWLEQLVARDVPGALLAVPLFTGLIVLWTMVGLVLGAVYELGNLGDRQSGLGSPSLLFTLLMLGLAWLPLPPLVALFPRRWWLWVLMSVLFAGLFGWLMPHLAGR